MAKFDLQAVIAEGDREPFEFTGPLGEDLELPHASTLTPRQALALDQGEFAEVLEEVAPKAAGAILDSPSYAAEALIRAWLEHAGLDQGESPASPNSSRNTARRSKPTSRRHTR